MPGIASVLNIAKEALLTHQASINVAGHNIANVDTPGYSRQVLNLKTNVSSPSGTGFFGNGVAADSVARQYDQFMVTRLNDQNSTIKNLEAMQQSLRIVETVFNEAPGLAINDLLSQFWESWQDLTNNPELSSSRQSVIQKAELLNSQLNMMTSEIAKTRDDVSLSLKAGIAGLNSLTEEIAALNAQISASESPKHQQNDLRDDRDALLKELAGLTNIKYFETSSGSYTVLLNDGHTLVEQNESWRVDWSDNNMYWLSTNSNGVTTRSELNRETALGGSIGGLIEINNQLIEGNPDNYLGRLNSLANSLIREVNQQHTQGVGTIRFSEPLTSAERAKNAVLLHSSLESKTATETIPAGSLSINGREIGRIDGAAAKYGLASTKTYNAATAINESYAGVNARLTTQVAGSAVSPMTAGDDASVLNFTINDVINVAYTVDSSSGPPDDTDPATLARNVANAINTSISTYNSNPANTPQMAIRAIVGTGLNGGAANSIVLQNTNPGDDSNIRIAGVDSTPGTAESNLGLTDGVYEADATNNTGALSLFSNDQSISLKGGADDRYLSQLGWAGAITYSDQIGSFSGAPVSFTLNGTTISANGTAVDIVAAIETVKGKTGVTAEVGNGTNGGAIGSVVFRSDSTDIIVTGINATEEAIIGFADFTKRSAAGADSAKGDGKLTYEFADNGVANSLMGLDYADQLVTDGGSFNIWLYNSNGTPALPQPVNVSMERAYTLNDVARAINVSVVKAINDPGVTLSNSWLTASVLNNQLILTPDRTHQFAFGGDDSNFLAAVGLNTFFTGHSADSIAINSVISNNPNHLAAGSINQFGEIFTGDNSNALKITNIQRKEGIYFTGGTTDTLDGHYNSLIAEIGLKARSVKTDLEFSVQVNDQLNQMRDATSGVSLDEEMANLIKFQHAYSAAAKLITASDEMLTTLLNAV